MFRYSSELLASFPTIRGGVAHANGLTNGPSPVPLLERYRVEQERVIAALGDRPLSELPSIASWRKAFTGFGVKPTQYRNAAEALLRRLTKKGGVPSISLLVDLANLVSITHALPVAVFDQAPVTGATVVRFADGTESFTDLGAEQPVHPEPGEVIFVDDAALVSARRWCWRQSAQSAASAATTQALLTVEAHHAEAERDVNAALGDLLTLLEEFQPQAEVRSTLLTPLSPSFLEN